MGREYSAAEVWEVLERDIPFYRTSGGGITLSGGEVLLQADFAAELLEKAHELSLHTAVDTAGFVSWSAFEKVLPHSDLFLYDIKAIHPELHRRATGQDNALILENYIRLQETGKPIWVRIPLVPGYNLDQEECQRIADFLKAHPPQRVELLRFHRMAEPKYRAMDMEYAMMDTPSPSMQEMEEIRTLMQNTLNCPIAIG